MALPPTPNLGLPQYDDSDTSALDVLINGVTSTLDTAIPAALDALPFVQAGTTTISGDGTPYTTINVAFPTPFASPPVVIVGGERGGSTVNTAVMVGIARSATTTGFQLELKATVNFSSSYTLPWIAVGVKP